MDVDLSRLRRGELIAGCGAVALLVSVFLLPWYGITPPPGWTPATLGVPTTRNGWRGPWLPEAAGGPLVFESVGPVYDVAQALDSPFVARSGMIQNVPHPEKTDLRVLTSPIKVNGERAELTAAPALGAHNDELLGERAEDAKARRG